MVGYGWVWLGMVGCGWTWLDMVGIWLGYGWMCSHVFLTIANQKLPTTPNLKSVSKGLKHTISNINEYGNINHGRRRRRRRRCGMWSFWPHLISYLADRQQTQGWHSQWYRQSTEGILRPMVLIQRWCMTGCGGGTNFRGRSMHLERPTRPVP